MSLVKSRNESSGENFSQTLGFSSNFHFMTVKKSVEKGVLLYVTRTRQRPDHPSLCPRRSFYLLRPKQDVNWSLSPWVEKISLHLPVLINRKTPFQNAPDPVSTQWRTRSALLVSSVLSPFMFLPGIHRKSTSTPSSPSHSPLGDCRLRGARPTSSRLPLNQEGCTFCDRL